MTASRVFVHVLRNGPLSRLALTELSGLSSPTVTRAVQTLLSGRYIVESATTGRRRVGRPAVQLSVAAERAWFIGIKLGTDELIGVATNLVAAVRAQGRIAIDDPSPQAVTKQAVILARRLHREWTFSADRPAGICIAVSGDVDRELGVVRYSPWLDWHHVSLASMLEASTGIPTQLENDVRSLTVAEQWFGAGVGAHDFAVVTVGTGIGCGIVVHDQVVEGAFGVAGEIGHLPVETDGPTCHCGSRGCIEAIASARAIAGQVSRVTGLPSVSLADAVEIARAHRSPAVDRVFARAGRAIGLGLASVANLFGPERIIISGEGLNAYDVFEQHIRDAFDDQAFGAAGRCELIIRPLGFEAWARGAATVAIRDYVLGTPRDAIVRS